MLFIIKYRKGLKMKIDNKIYENINKASAYLFYRFKESKNIKRVDIIDVNNYKTNKKDIKFSIALQGIENKDMFLILKTLKITNEDQLFLVSNSDGNYNSFSLERIIISVDYNDDADAVNNLINDILCSEILQELQAILK